MRPGLRMGDCEWADGPRAQIQLSCDRLLRMDHFVEFTAFVNGPDPMLQFAPHCCEWPTLMLAMRLRMKTKALRLRVANGVSIFWNSTLF